MRFKVEWNQEDLERLLRETLLHNGFVIPTNQMFKWHYRPKMRVTIEVEPATNSEPQQTVETVVPETITKTSEKKEVSEYDTWDPALLPSDVNIEILRQLDRAAAKERNKK